MPNKRIDDLKNDTQRRNGQVWQDHFGVKNMTTRELTSIEANNEFGKNPSEVKKRILKERKK